MDKLGCCWFWKLEREKIRAGKERVLFIPRSAPLDRARNKDSPNRQGWDSQSHGEFKEEYKEEAMAENVLTLTHLGSEMAQSEQKKRTEAGGGGQGKGSVC